jgi:hypothetical protein
MWHVLLYKGLREAQLSSQHQRICEHNHYGLPSCGTVFASTAAPYDWQFLKDKCLAVVFRFSEGENNIRIFVLKLTNAHLRRYSAVQFYLLHRHVSVTLVTIFSV